MILTERPLNGQTACSNDFGAKFGGRDGAGRGGEAISPVPFSVFICSLLS